MVHRKNHFVLVAYPAQGHINPALQLAKRLVLAGAQVTFVTTLSAHRRMSERTEPNDSFITFCPFSDGYDDGFNGTADDFQHYGSEIRRRGSEALGDLIRASVDEDRRVTCLIYTLLLPWAAEAARNHGVASALLWIQPAIVFDIYYYYFNGYKEALSGNNGDYSVELPGLPPLNCRDLPSFLLPSNTYTAIMTSFEDQFQCLNRELTKPRVLVNTFEELEPIALGALDGDDKFDFIPIGPLIPSAFSDGKDPYDTCFGADMFQSSSNEYLEWLNSKEKESVVYVSFGTMVLLKKKQMEEIARGLVETGRPFLWVVRPNTNKSKEEEEEEDIQSFIDRISAREEREIGIVVQWCSQIEVLSHGSVGCFVSHCGWNSTLESVVVGVPVVAFPQWSDQGTNAKLIEDVWGTGVRVRVGVSEGEEILVEGEEIKRCVEMVMGDDERGEEIKRNAEKWKGLARKAVEDGGSSERNLMAFLKKMGQDQCL